jgi:hypothetical protein
MVFAGRNYPPGVRAPSVIRVGSAESVSIVPGSANGDGILDVADCVYLLGHLFRGGPPPPCERAADVNDDCVLDSSDVIYTITYEFLGGPPPPAGTGCRLVDLDRCPGLACESAPETGC